MRCLSVRGNVEIEIKISVSHWYEIYQRKAEPVTANQVQEENKGEENLNTE